MVTAVLVLYHYGHDFLTSGEPFTVRVTNVINGLLFVVIVMELLHTVVEHFEFAGFQLKPFLIIGHHLRSPPHPHRGRARVPGRGGDWIGLPTRPDRTRGQRRRCAGPRRRPDPGEKNRHHRRLTPRADADGGFLLSWRLREEATPVDYSTIYTGYRAPPQKGHTRVHLRHLCVAAVTLVALVAPTAPPGRHAGTYGVHRVDPSPGSGVGHRPRW